MRYLLLLFICLSSYGGYLSVSLDYMRSIDLCNNRCKENENCEIQDGEPSCKIRGNLCEPNPCKNGGSCTVKNGEMSCNCTIDYNGERCEIDSCSLLQCEEYETCIIENEDPICKKKTSVCEPNPCKNGGSCIVRNRIISCNCTDGYSGGKCEIGKSNVTTEDLVTEMPKSKNSMSTTTTHSEKLTSTNSGSTAEETTVPNTDDFTTSSRTRAGFTESFTETTTPKATVSTENKDETSSVSLTNRSTRPSESTSIRNRFDHTKSSETSSGTSVETTSICNNDTIEISQAFTSIISSNTPTAETSLDKFHTSPYVVVSDDSSTAKYTTSNLNSSMSSSKMSSESSTPAAFLKSTENLRSTSEISNITSVNNNSDKDLCQPNPCENGGSCTVREGTIICDCSAGYSGEKCEIGENARNFY